MQGSKLHIISARRNRTLACGSPHYRSASNICESSGNGTVCLKIMTMGRVDKYGCLDRGHKQSIGGPYPAPTKRQDNP